MFLVFGYLEIYSFWGFKKMDNQKTDSAFTSNPAPVKKVFFEKLDTVAQGDVLVVKAAPLTESVVINGETSPCFLIGDTMLFLVPIDIETDTGKMFIKATIYGEWYMLPVYVKPGGNQEVRNMGVRIADSAKIYYARNYKDSIRSLSGDALFTDFAYSPPLKSIYVTCPLGRYRKYISRCDGRGDTLVWYRHSGVDMRAAYGTRVFAEYDGVVRSYTDLEDGGGNSLILDHGLGICTKYLHTSKSLVAVGDTVKSGQPIALSGNSGGVPAHLHVTTMIGSSVISEEALKKAFAEIEIVQKNQTQRSSL